MHIRSSNISILHTTVKILGTKQPSIALRASLSRNLPETITKNMEYKKKHIKISIPEISKTQNKISRKNDHGPNEKRRRSIEKITNKARHNEKAKQVRERGREGERESSV